MGGGIGEVFESLGTRTGNLCDLHLGQAAGVKALQAAEVLRRREGQAKVGVVRGGVA
jgi:hypothetical protein